MGPSGPELAFRPIISTPDWFWWLGSAGLAVASASCRTCCLLRRQSQGRGVLCYSVGAMGVSASRSSTKQQRRRAFAGPATRGRGVKEEEEKEWA